MDTSRWLCTWTLLCLVLVAITTGESITITTHSSLRTSKTPTLRTKRTTRTITATTTMDTTITTTTTLTSTKSTPSTSTKRVSTRRSRSTTSRAQTTSADATVTSSLHPHTPANQIGISSEPDPLHRHFGDETRRRRIKIVTIQSDPYIRLNWSRGLIGNERYEGFYRDMIARLADLAGFDYSLHLVADAKLGHQGEEGGWTGMVGELLSGSADLTLGPLSVTRERQTVVDFTSPISEVKLAIIMSRNSKSNSRTKPTALPMMTLPELLAQSELKFAALRESDAVRALMTSLDSNARALYRRLQEQSMTSLMGNMYEAMEFVRREGYALVLDQPTAEYYIGLEPCDLSIVASFLGGRHYALATRKGEPLLGELNRALQTLKGQRSWWESSRRKWWHPQCVGASTADVASVTEIEKTKDTSRPTKEPTTSQSQPVLRVVTELNPPFVIQQQERGLLSGYTIELLENIARLAGFRYDISFPRDGAGFGKRKQNRWSGMTGQLVREEVDLAAAPFTSNPRRDRVLSYTKPFLHSTLSILIRTSTTNDDLPIFFMEDLLNQTDYSYGVLKGSQLERDLRHSKEHVASEIWKNIAKNKRANVVRTLEDGLRKVRTEKFAFIIPSTFATYLSSQAPCDLMALDQFMFITNYMFAVNKGSSLVAKIDAAMIQLQEDGVLQMLFHRWWNTGDCLGATEPPKSPLGNKNTSGGASDRTPVSPNWIHRLFTYSTKWQSPSTTTMALYTPKPALLKSTTIEVIADRESTTAAMVRSDDADPVPGPIASEEDSTDRQLSSATTSEGLLVQTSPITERSRHREKGHRHRHRHRHRERGRHRGRNRERNRNRHAKNVNVTISTTEVTSIASSELYAEGADNETEAFVPRIKLAEEGATVSSFRPSTTAVPPPKPPVWDGKYVFEEDFLSTRTPENFTVDLELIPAEEDSIRIFPFTYKPDKDGFDNGDTDFDNPIEKTRHHEGHSPILPATVAPPEDSGGRRGKNRKPQKTPTLATSVDYPTGREVMTKTDPDWSDTIERETTPIIRLASPRGDDVTPRMGNDISAASAKTLNSAMYIALLSTFHFILWFLTHSRIRSRTYYLL